MNLLTWIRGDARPGHPSRSYRREATRHLRQNWAKAKGFRRLSRGAATDLLAGCEILLARKESAGVPASFVADDVAEKRGCVFTPKTWDWRRTS